jgi:hypothetical protein
LRQEMRELEPGREGEGDKRQTHETDSATGQEWNREGAWGGEGLVGW